MIIMVKPGYKTSEFWLSLVAMVLGAVMASGLVVEGTALMKMLGLLGSVLTAMGYQVSRTMIKRMDVAAGAAVSAVALGGPPSAPK